MATTTKTKKSKVYVIDDDDAFRLWFGIQLESLGFTATGFGSAGEFLDVAAKLEPGCVISDIRMPGLDGLELLDALQHGGVALPVILITGQGDVELAVRAMRAGAVDFIVKPFSEAAILASLNLAQKQLDLDMKRHAIGDVAAQRLASLTGREREVLSGVVGGMSSKAIASHLGISRRTVEYYRSQIMAKTGAGSLSEVVRFGMLAGITPMDPDAVSLLDKPEDKTKFTR